MKSGRLLPLSSLAKQWGWSVSKLHRLVAANRIPHVRIGARNDVYFEEAVVDAWLAQRRGGPSLVAPAAAPVDGGLDAELALFGMTRDELTLPH